MNVFALVFKFRIGVSVDENWNIICKEGENRFYPLTVTRVSLVENIMSTSTYVQYIQQTYKIAKCTYTFLISYACLKSNAMNRHILC